MRLRQDAIRRRGQAVLRLIRDRLLSLAGRIRLGVRWSKPSAHVSMMRTTWNRLSRKSRLGFVSHLEKGEEWDEVEFDLVGERFVTRMIERFEDYARAPIEEAELLEIGCGVGRFLKQFAPKVRTVTGVGFSKEMLDSAAERCAGLSNVSVRLNNGSSLEAFSAQSFDFVICAGVMQHITHIDVVTGYVLEALRVLRPGSHHARSSALPKDPGHRETLEGGRRGVGRR